MTTQCFKLQKGMSTLGMFNVHYIVLTVFYEQHEQCLIKLVFKRHSLNNIEQISVQQQLQYVRFGSCFQMLKCEELHFTRGECYIQRYTPHTPTH